MALGTERARSKNAKYIRDLPEIFFRTFGTYGNFFLGAAVPKVGAVKKSKIRP